MEKQLVIDNVQITICDTLIEMGLAAARHTENLYRHILSERRVVNMIFAAAPSQEEYLESLIKKTEMDFSRVNAFHMDEYIGLEKDAPASFGVYLRTHIFDKAAFKSINYIDGNVETCSEECFRYGKLISAFPVDIVCAGVGENGALERSLIAKKLAFLGVKLDEEMNNKIAGYKEISEGVITTADSSIPLYVMPTNEEVMIARDTYNLTEK